MEGRISTAANTRNKPVPCKWCTRSQNAIFSVWNVKKKKKKKNGDTWLDNTIYQKDIIWSFACVKCTCSIVSMQSEWCLDLLSSNRFGCQTLTCWSLHSNSNRPYWKRIFPDLGVTVSATVAAHCCWWNTIVRLWNSKWRHRIDEFFYRLEASCVEQNRKEKKENNNPFEKFFMIFPV